MPTSTSVMEPRGSNGGGRVIVASQVWTNCTSRRCRLRRCYRPLLRHRPLRRRPARRRRRRLCRRLCRRRRPPRRPPPPPPVACPCITAAPPRFPYDHTRASRVRTRNLRPPPAEAQSREPSPQRRGPHAAPPIYVYVPYTPPALSLAHHTRAPSPPPILGAPPPRSCPQCSFRGSQNRRKKRSAASVAGRPSPHRFCRRVRAQGFARGQSALGDCRSAITPAWQTDPEPRGAFRTEPPRLEAL